MPKVKKLEERYLITSDDGRYKILAAKVHENKVQKPCQQGDHHHAESRTRLRIEPMDSNRFDFSFTDADTAKNIGELIIEASKI